MSTKRNESNVHAFFRRAFEVGKVEIIVIFLLLIALVVLLAVSCNNKNNKPGEIPSPSPTVRPTDESTPNPTVDPDTTEPATATPTPSPTPKIYGACSSVTKDVNSIPEAKDNWEIDYLMLVNWDNRLKYSGNPENLVRLQDALDTSLYHLQNPITVSASDRNYVIETEDDNYLRGNAVAVEALDKMCRAVMDQGCTYVKISETGSYRNYATQEGFWQNRLKQDPHYGDDPYRTLPKTVPGNASEHRTGLGFDVWLGVGGDDDESYKWLTANCYQYGFILRYPSNKTKITGIQYERWHYRYVGVEAATEIHDLGMCLEEYIAYKNGEPIPDGTHTPTPTPTPTPDPTLTPTPDPTEDLTPTPTGAPTPDTTPTPTPESAPGPNNTPTPTPKGSTDPNNTPTPTPKGNTDPNNTPTPTPKGNTDPSDTPTPTPKSEPSDTPTPTPKGDPTSGNTPTPTPKSEPGSAPTPTPDGDPTPTPEPPKDPTPTPDPNNDWGGNGAGTN